MSNMSKSEKSSLSKEEIVGLIQDAYKEVSKTYENVKNWRTLAWAIHATVIDKWKPGSDEDRNFLALAMAGEAGEVANVVKKLWAGYPNVNAELLVGELADVQIYLFLLSKVLDIDLNVASYSKLLSLLDKDNGKWKAFRDHPAIVEALKEMGNE